jgi:aryl-alcohol dehydrogenase-like predicted oxidoreductase
MRMRYRSFGHSGGKVAEIGFGAWAIGDAWGQVDDAQSIAALHAALDAGVDFIDTADVYGDGHSERLIARALKERGGERPLVATKVGRRLAQQVVSGYSAENLQAFVDRSRRNLEMDCLDLVQLHCPPTDAYYRPDLFELMERMVERGTLRRYGVSVERVEEALKAIEYPGVASVQIIFNMFRLRPAELFLQQARQRGVAVIARVPLASGLLSGKFARDTRFEANDHRQFNRHGEAFDVGETFSGVPYEVGLQAVEELRLLVPEGATLAQLALRWILMHEAVTVIIPGARNPRQALDNIAASTLEPLAESTMAKVRDIYDRLIRAHVHQRW